MIIKVNGSELEITERGSVYLGIREKGQTFRDLDELNATAAAALDDIRLKAEQLIRQAEGWLAAPSPAGR